jgi:hypothetical protein
MTVSMSGTRGSNGGENIDQNRFLLYGQEQGGPTTYNIAKSGKRPTLEEMNEEVGWLSLDVPVTCSFVAEVLTPICFVEVWGIVIRSILCIGQLGLAA